MKPWKWFVYIIKCKDGFYYTGMTWNIDQRVEQHRLGTGSNFTSKHGFGELVYLEKYSNIIEARNREHQVKDYSRKKKELLFSNPQNCSRLRSNNKYSSSVSEKFMIRKK